MKLNEDAIEGLRVLVETCQSLNIELALIGASALVLYSQTNMLQAEAVEATRDIDAITSALDVDADIDYGLRGAFLIGLDIAANLEQAILEPIHEFLAKIEDEDSSIISRAVGHSSLQLREAFQLFEAMKQGLLNAG
ncbi:MAG: hypothetical protein QME41_10105 [Actinomycetota bacterium]|nr:hypothetical protein [Actinomycetota bacterium]